MLRAVQWPLIVVGVLLANVSQPLPAAAQCLQPLPTGMVSWWPGDGTAKDIQDSNDGTLMGGATFGPGEVDQAFSFNGSTAFVQIPNALNLNPTTAITMDAWINPTAACTRPYCTVVAKSDATGVGRSYGMWVTGPGAGGGAGSGALDVEGSGLGIAFAFTSSGVIPNSVFTHVATVITSGGGFALYVNGVLQPITSSGTPTLAATTAPVTIGNADPGDNEYFDGMIDEVEIFNRALSATEIHAIFNAGADGKCKANATACSDDGQCGTGHCADGVCCDTACSGACDTCDASGNVGTCVPNSPGSPGNPSCAPFVCDGTDASCPTSCSGDSECASGAFCNGSVCASREALGQPCGSNNDACQSGFCVDTVCCNSACTQTGFRCNQPGRLGLCSAVGAPAPALSPWGLALAGLALAAAGIFGLRRRAVTQ